MRRVFKTRYFARWAIKAEVPDPALCVAVEEMERGLIDADLGGGLYKKRIALSGKGKRGGARVIVATRRQDRWIFLLGYTKNEGGEPGPVGLRAQREIAQDYLSADEASILAMLAQGRLEEICHSA